ncbi:hypothetical protein NFI95_05780 [Acetobacteraceae bacterium KSS8]|uniref:Uncharacterized protein n=1 Tax=Endosaccharibacter trunci TaxID=2812733 RepID=A0ABT1W4Z4_9PROT|nr:hypothetical protein [Acetobacteraceae bacterium KSS8]
MPHPSSSARLATANLAIALDKIEAAAKGNENIETWAVGLRVLAESRDWPRMEVCISLLLECLSADLINSAVPSILHAVADAIEHAAELDQHTNKHAVSAEVA